MTCVVLTGFMGTGKSTVGRILADALGAEFVDTDELIEARRGPIQQIFDHEGEAAFRRYEREVADELSARVDGNDLVVSTGGRFMLDPYNVDALHAAHVFCLVADVETIVARVTAGQQARPLLAADDVADRVRELIAERAAGYSRFPQVITDHRSPSMVADEILRQLGSPR